MSWTTQRESAAAVVVVVVVVVVRVRGWRVDGGAVCDVPSRGHTARLCCSSHCLTECKLNALLVGADEVDAPVNAGVADLDLAADDAALVCAAVLLLAFVGMPYDDALLPFVVVVGV